MTAPGPAAASRSAAQIKDEHLTAQAAVAFEREVEAFFAGRPDWDRARTVVDLGCGNGAYTRRLAARFPDVHLIGVDTHPDAIAAARRAPPLSNLAYVLGPLTNVRGPVDLVVSRFCLMYVDDLAPIARWVEANVVGAVIQVDNDDALLVVPPVLEPLIEATHIGRLRRSPPRTPATTTAPAWAEVGFAPAWEERLAVRGDTARTRAALHDLMVLTAEVRSGSPLPDEVVASAGAWREGTDVLQLGIRASAFRRTSPWTDPRPPAPWPPEARDRPATRPGRW